MIKTIVMDMDGTLLDANNKILEQTKASLIQLEQQGVTLILSSGRSYRRLLSYAKELMMDVYGGYLVEINGCAIYDVKTADRICLSKFTLAQCHTLLSYFKKLGLEIIGNYDDGMCCLMSEDIYNFKKKYRQEHGIDDDFPWTGGPFSILMDARDGYPNLFYVQDAQEVQIPFNKACVTHYDQRVLHMAISKIKADLGDQFWIGLVASRWLELMPKGVSKASGLQALCDRFQLKKEEMMCFGDGENDIEMMEFCGKAIAMENALDSVKANADFITLSNNDNGIAYAIEYFKGDFYAV